MALATSTHSSAGTHQHLPQEHSSSRYPRYDGAQNKQNSPPFSYTGPRLQTSGGSRRVKKVRGLVAQFEKSPEIPPRNPRRVQPTLGLKTDLSRDNTSWKKSGNGEGTGTLALKLEQAEREIRKLSQMQHLVVEQNEEDTPAKDKRSDRKHDAREEDAGQQQNDNNEEASFPDPEKPHFLQLSLQQSPQQLSFPEAPIELDAGPDHELLVPPRRPRIRPHSYTAPRFSDRPTNKIASSRSRGLRANSSPPNFLRPLSGSAPKPVPGEDMERDPLSIRFLDIEADPRSPMSPIGGTLVSNEIKAALEKLEKGMAHSRSQSPMPPSPPAKRRSKARWSSLPVSLMKFAAKKRASKSEEDTARLATHPLKEVVTLTEENLQRWEDEVGHVPKMYRLGYGTPISSVEDDMQAERATPVPQSRYAPSPEPGPEPQFANVNVHASALLTPPTSPPLAQYASSLSSTTPALGSPSLHVTTPTLRNPSATATPLAIRSSATSTLIRRFPQVPGAQPTLAAQKEELSVRAEGGFRCEGCGERLEHPSKFGGERVCGECVGERGCGGGLR